MEILEPVHNAADGAVFTVIIGGVRTELPWVDHAQLLHGVLILESVATGSGQPASTYLRDFSQAAWQISLGEEANSAPQGRRVRASSPDES